MMMSASKGKFHHNNNNGHSGSRTFLPSQSMFHACQESSMLFNEFVRRNINSFEQRRRAEFTRGDNSLKQLPAATNNFPRQPLPTKLQLKIEVQGSDFASLHDGREAWAVNDSLAAIMEDTKCMLLFADQNDPNAESMGFFNQVTIIGDMPNIDCAMDRIREFSPITVAISLKNVKDQFKREDLAQLIRQWCLGDELGLFSRVQFSILFPPNPFIITQSEDANSLSLVVRGSRKDHKMMVNACEALLKLLFTENCREQFFAALEIPVSQRRMIVGSPEGVLISAISSETKATIHFPSSSSDCSLTYSTYLLSGSADSVIRAVRMIQDVSPVRIEFDVEHSDVVFPMCTSEEQHRELDMFDSERGVIVQVRKSAYEGSFRMRHEQMRHSLTLMTSEENVKNLYVVRSQLLLESHWGREPCVQRVLTSPRFLEYLKVLVMESAVRAYIGDGKVISVCRCRVHQQGFQQQQQQVAETCNASANIVENDMTNGRLSIDECDGGYVPELHTQMLFALHRLS
uniref:GLD-3 KH5 domain-containing protein n=1 Tax=Globodera rostochiensis TaxID=31243 RepID=A0A914GYM4_GLORO